MKILHIITSLYTGGAEKLMVDILPQLKGKGYDVDLLLFDGSDTPFRREIDKSGIKVFDLGNGGSLYSPVRLIKLIPFLRKYDVVHTHTTAPQLLTAIDSLLCHVPLITTEHNTTNRRRDWKWYAPIDRWMYNQYKHVICISDQTERHLRDYLGSVKINMTTIYNGIDTRKYSIAEPLNDFGDLINCRVKIMQVAAFRYQKDQDTVIRSLKILPDDFHLFLVGDGVRRRELEKLVSDLDLKPRVHFMGIRSDVPQLLKSSDIVVMSSHIEGFGLAAVESMAAAKPVIASNVDGLREVVEGAGILFQPGDVKGLATKILELDGDRDYYEKIAAACVERAKDFDISKMVDKYIEIYQEISKK